jgi:predicted dehydrogenase
MREGVEDVVFCLLRSQPAWPLTCIVPGWIRTRNDASPVVGEDRTVIFDDMALEGKITGLRQVLRPDVKWLRRVRGAVRRHLERAALEPRALRTEMQQFVQCVRNHERPILDEAVGLRVVPVLEALRHSLDASRRQRTARPRALV